MDQTRFAEAWKALEAHKTEMEKETVAGFFAADPQRYENFHVELDDVLVDFSKHRVTKKTLELLFDLVRAAGLEERRAALFGGDYVNVTEHRAAMHMALRKLTDGPVMAEGRDVMPDVRTERAKVLAFAEGVRKGEITAANGAPFTDVVNIGIGGSDLGPAMAGLALSPFIKPGLRLHFVANVDGSDLGDKTALLPLETTLFIICSKTFTTLETMTNAEAARKLVKEKLGDEAVAAHFCAVSTNLDEIAKFGIKENRVFGFWDFVGGRLSVWSSIGLSLAIGIGAEKFDKFLLGGQDIDKHFQDAPLEQNVPVLMALLGVWYRNFWDFATHAVIPYDQRMARFPAYLQQLEMESNGKSVSLEGKPAAQSTAPVLFGEPGTNGQHAFFQMLHQGTDVVPIDFLVAAQPNAADAYQHQLLVANCLAQSEALMRGRSLEEATAGLQKSGMDAAAVEKLAPHKVFSGNRPSSVFLYKKLSPRVLGQLIALYEHKVFTQSVVWNINAFDQWGVELGKELAKRLVPIVADKTASTDALDSSTAGLIAQIRKLNKGG